MPKWQDNYFGQSAQGCKETVWLILFIIVPIFFANALALPALYFFLIICVLVQLGFAVYYFIPFIKYQPPTAKNFTPPVSVIIAAHNELNNLQRFLPNILQQRYPNFEVIVVDDRSTDGSAAYLKTLGQQFVHFRYVLIRNAVNTESFKKNALAQGIAAAANNILLFTDADCMPLCDSWITNMVAGFDNEFSMVVGFSPYIKKAGFLNHLIRFETLFTAIQYLSFSAKGDSYMGVGRNLAYTKACFFQINGFNSHINTLGGDDDLFVQEAARQYKVNIAISKESQTASIPKNTYQEWIIQKRRHLQVGRQYKLPDKLRIGVFMLSNIFFYLTLIFLLFVSDNFFPLSIIYTLRGIVVYIVYVLIARKLKEPLSVFLLPVLDLVYFLQYLVLGASVLIFKKVRWK